MSDRDASGARRSASTVRTRVLYPFPYHLASRNSPPSPSIVDGAAAAEAKPAEQTGKTRRRYTKLAVPMRHPRRDDSLTQGASARRPARRAETIGSKLPKNPHGARSQGCGAEGSGCATSGVNEPGGRPSLGTLKKTSQHSKKTDTEGLRCPCRLMQRGLRAGSCATPPRAPDGEPRKNALSGPNG